MAKKSSGRRGPAKSGALMLRIDPGLHAELADTAARLGLDTTGLLRLMIRRSLPHYQMEARLIEQQAEEAGGRLEQWRQDNPGRPIREFWDDYYRFQVAGWTKDLIELQLDPRFRMAEAFGASARDLFSPPEGTPPQAPAEASERAERTRK